MNTTEAFKKIMMEQTEIALATSVKERPNVRIVNFFYDQEKGCLFFSTFKGSQKVAEFATNETVAFTTIPKENTNHVRVQQAQVKRSSLSVYDTVDRWVEKIPSYAENIEQAGDMLELYEVHFTEAIVILGMNSKETIHI